jgi:diguanylate cyclase (GGDEF)-like protein
VLDRRAFEDRLSVALEQARRDGSHLAVIVGEVMGLLVVHSRFGFEAGEVALREAERRVERAVHGFAAAVARIGEAEFAVLVAPAESREEADRVMARIARAFVEPVLVQSEPITMSLAMSVNVGPGRRRTDADLLWRTAEDSAIVRSRVLQRLVSEVHGGSSDLATVAQRFADEGVSRFGFEGCVIAVAGREWRAPAVLPARAPDAERPLVTEGRTIGSIRWWGAVPDESDRSGVDVVLGHVATSLDRAAAVDALDHRARTDPLTGLLNRDGLAHALRDETRLYAVGVIDLDHFKQVNDEHGHDAGDLVLADLASLLQRGRNDDVIARWGGEEIVIVMPDTTVDGAVARLQRLLEEARAFVRVDAVGPITFSAGVTSSGPNEPFAAAMRRADEAMYRAKRAGRARVEVG